MNFLNHIIKLAGLRLCDLGLMLCITAIVSTTSAYAQTAEVRRFISSQDIYENPDDHELNLNYAKQEIKTGEMLNAASALERMLYANPNWHSARLLYAAVLYRLDDPKAALRELSLIKTRNLNAEQIETYERYFEQFKTPLPPRSKTSLESLYAPHDAVKAAVTFGVRSDNNAGNALTDEVFGAGNQGDVSFLAQGRLEFSTEITDTKKISGYATIGGQLRRHDTFSNADYDVIDVQAGLRTKPGETGRISLGIDARQVTISGEKYLEQIGPRVSFSQTISKKTKASFSLSVYDQNYDVLSNAPLENERDGIKTRMQLGLQTYLKPAQKVTVALGYDTKTADIGEFAYDGPQALLGFENIFDDGVYMKTRVQLRLLNYRDSFDPDIDKREETRFAFRHAFGMPVKALANTDTVKRAAVELGVNYNNRASNIDSNDYNNVGMDLKLKANF